MSARPLKSLATYALVTYALLLLRPRCMFREDGRPMQFGVGRDQTLLPFWLIALLAAIYAPGY